MVKNLFIISGPSNKQELFKFTKAEIFFFFINSNNL